MRSGLTPGVLRAVYDKAAHRYDRWHAFATAHSDQRGRRLLARQCVKEGDDVLDAGGGTGLMTELAATAVGPGGHVTLADLSTGMLGQAMDRFAATPLRGRVSLVVADILRLPFGDGCFDCVLSTYSVCPLVAPEEGVTEMFRVVKPGGLLGIAHSCEPRNPIVRWLADRVEDLVWRWPQVSLGCRSVSVLPHLTRLGAEVVFDRRIGIPLWPFRVFVVRRP